MKIHASIGLLLLLLLSGCGSGETPSGTQLASRSYSVTYLGNYDGLDARLNNRGEVVAGRNSASQGYSPWLYREGQWTPLIIEGNNIYATGFTDSGVIVGWRYRQVGDGSVRQVFVYRNGVVEDVPLRENVSGYQAWINEAEEILLETVPASSILFRSGQQIEVSVRPYAVNRAGQIAGVDSRNHSVAMFWQNGAASPLPTLPESPQAIPVDINEQGAAVGTSNPRFPLQTQAVLWQHGTVTRIGTLAGGASYARAINNQNEVVGFSRTDICPTPQGGQTADSIPYCEPHAIFYKDGVLTDLNALISFRENLVLRDAIDINDNGEILVVGNQRGNTNQLILVLLRPYK